MVSKIRTFLLFPNSHKWIFIKIALIVPLVQIGVKTIKFNRTFKVLNYFADSSRQPREDELKLVRRYTNYLFLYHKQFPFVGKCLARSLTLWFLLKRSGIETDLRFGIKKENQGILAHAWVEHQGNALMTEDERKENFIPFSESVLTKVDK